MTEPSSPSSPPDPSTAAVPEAEKKGLSPLAWVLIVLGVLFALTMGACVACGLVVTQAAREIARDIEDNPAKALAELAVRANPEVELVSTDDNAGTMTLRNARTGDEFTLNFDAIAQGRFGITGPDGGQVVFDADPNNPAAGITATGSDGSVSRIGALSGEDMPNWMLVYPGGQLGAGGFLGATADGVAGAFQMTTDDPCTDVSDYFHQALPAAGFAIGAVSASASAAATVAMTMLQATMDDPERSLTVTMIDADAGGCTISSQFGGAP